MSYTSKNENARVTQVTQVTRVKLIKFIFIDIINGDRYPTDYS